MTSGSAGQTQIEVKEVNIMVIKEERPADEETRIEGGEITAKGTEENAGMFHLKVNNNLVIRFESCHGPCRLSHKLVGGFLPS